MTIASVITGGFGSFGTPSLVITDGYAASANVVVADSGYRPNISMRSGFRVAPRDLVREWTGLMVHWKEVDLPHPQMFVKGVRDYRPMPDARPEAPDVFLTTNQVKASDL